MSPKPPRAAVRFVELFAPIESAEGVLGDLEEEFAGQLIQSGQRAARRWYWRQALRTTVHLVWGTVRAAPWSTTALVLASFVATSLLHGVMHGWVGRLVSNLPIYDYDTSVWSWRAAAVVRFVAVPLAIGWSIAALARGREMIITTLVVGVLMGPLLLSVTMNVQQLFFLIGQRGGSYWMLVHAFDVRYFQEGVFALSVLVGGMMRRLQQLHGSAGVAA